LRAQAAAMDDKPDLADAAAGLLAEARWSDHPDFQTEWAEGQT
jgi:hypothetical protein